MFCKLGGFHEQEEILLKMYYSLYISITFKKYLPSFIQSAVFTGRAARQTNHFYILRIYDC